MVGLLIGLEFTISNIELRTEEAVQLSAELDSPQLSLSGLQSSFPLQLTPLASIPPNHVGSLSIGIGTCVILWVAAELLLALLDCPSCPVLEWSYTSLV